MTDPVLPAESVAIRKALGHAHGALVAAAEALKIGRSEHLSIEGLERIAKECADARALLIDGCPSPKEPS
jgi:hypothetical protein